MNFKTETEAVNYSVADRPKDQKNYDLDKTGGLPFSRSEIERLLASKGYKEYQRFRFFFTAVIPKEGWLEVVLAPITQNAHRETILTDFVNRANTEFVDPRFQQSHNEIALPVRETLRSRLLVLESRGGVIIAQAYNGTGFAGKTLTREEVLQRLRRYADGYYAPLAYETTTKGEWRFDKGHVSDPHNPHSYDHLHVYHKLYPYHTTIRCTPF